jgi:hypothetical protein
LAGVLEEENPAVRKRFGVGVVGALVVLGAVVLARPASAEPGPPANGADTCAIHLNAGIPDITKAMPGLDIPIGPLGKLHCLSGPKGGDAKPATPVAPDAPRIQPAPAG